MTPEARPSKLSEAISLGQKEIRQHYPTIASIAHSVIQIAPYKDGYPLGLGSGVVIDGNRILTAAHVVADAQRLVYYMSANRMRLSTSGGGKVIIDESLDIALVPLPKVFHDMIRPVTYTPDITDDNPQFLIGYPQYDRRLDWELGRDATIHTVLASMGIEGRLTAIVLDPFLAIPAGASGSPIVDSTGILHGIATQGISREGSRSNTVIFAMPMNAIQKAFASEL